LLPRARSGRLLKDRKRRIPNPPNDDSPVLEGISVDQLGPRYQLMPLGQLEGRLAQPEMPRRVSILSRIVLRYHGEAPRALQQLPAILRGLRRVRVLAIGLAVIKIRFGNLVSFMIESSGGRHTNFARVTRDCISRVSLLSHPPGRIISDHFPSREYVCLLSHV